MSQAVIRSAERLGLDARVLAGVLGLSEPTVSRLKRGDYVLAANSKAFERAALVVRIFQSLDAISGSDHDAMQAWMLNENHVLGAAPVERLRSLQGLVAVVAYLDSRRAVI